MLVADLFNDFLSGLLDFSKEEEPSFDWDKRPKNTSGAQLQHGDLIVLAGKQHQAITTWVGVSPVRLPKYSTKIWHGYIGSVERDGEFWPQYIVTEGNEPLDMDKAAVFRVRGFDDWLSLEYCPAMKPYSLAVKDGLVKCVADDSPAEDDTMRMGWQKTSQGYRFYFKTSADDAIRVADNGGDLEVGQGRDTDITFALIKYSRPTTFGWESRPRFRDGDRVENGDRVILSANYRRTTAVAETGGYRSDLVTEYVTRYKPDARWLAVFSNSPTDQIVWTVRKSPKNNTELTCEVEGNKNFVYLSSILDSGRDRCALDDTINWRDCSTGWEITPSGDFSLFFESHPTTAVSHDCVIQDTKDALPIYFTLDKYTKSLFSFEWADRPIPTDGFRVQDGDKVIFRLQEGGSVYALKWGDDWQPGMGKEPSVVWTFRKSPMGKINLETTIENKTLTWCVYQDGDYYRSGWRTDVKEQDASTRWTKTDGGYMVHFESRQEVPLYHAGILQPTKANFIAYINLERVK